MHSANKVYKNENCAKCNGVTNESLLSCVPPLSMPMLRGSSKSLQVLFDLSQFGTEISLSIRIRQNDGLVNLQNTSLSISINMSSVSQQLQDLQNQQCRLYAISSDEDISVLDVKKYLTICGQIISVVCLLILLGMYFTHKVLRNLPGLVLISLSLALMLSQVCFLFAINVSISYVSRADNETCLNNEFWSSNYAFLSHQICDYVIILLFLILKQKTRN